MKTISQDTSFGKVNGTPRVWLRLEGLLVLILSILFYAHAGASWWRFGLFLLAPDLAMAGYWLNPRVGAIIYNLVHSYVGPGLLATAALASAQPALFPWA